MIRHIVFFKFRDSATDDERRELVAALCSLKEKIPLVKDIELGEDIAKSERSYDLALNTLFDSSDDLESYRTDPYHVKVVERIRELCKEHVKVDYEL